MTFAISTKFNEGRLVGARDAIDAGSGAGKIRIYGGTKAANVNTAPGSSPLVEIVLSEPCGTVTPGSNQLVLTAAAAVSQITNSGIATWCRIVDGDGNTLGDGDVSDTLGSGDIKISNTTLWAGAYVSLVSAILS